MLHVYRVGLIYIHTIITTLTSIRLLLLHFWPHIFSQLIDDMTVRAGRFALKQFFSGSDVSF